MKKNIVLTLLVLSGIYSSFSYGSTKETNICIWNVTDLRHHIDVSDVKIYEFDGDDTPESNFKNIWIEPRRLYCARIEVDMSYRPAFDILVDGVRARASFRTTDHKRGYNPDWDNEYDEFSNYQWGVVQGFSRLRGYDSRWWHSQDWKLGGSCINGANCRIFEIN